MAPKRAYELTFVPTPKSKVQHVWTRFYVPELGDDDSNHAHAMRAVRKDYPKAVAVSAHEVTPPNMLGGILSGANTRPSWRKVGGSIYHPRVHIYKNASGWFRIVVAGNASADGQEDYYSNRHDAQEVANVMARQEARRERGH